LRSAPRARRRLRDGRRGPDETGDRLVGGEPDQVGQREECVSGFARFTVGETSYDAPAGTFVMIPPGAPHTFANPGDQALVLLNTFTPDLYVQYFRDLRDMIADGHELTPDATIQVMSRYATVPASDFA
jgi:Cupin domain